MAASAKGHGRCMDMNCFQLRIVSNVCVMYAPIVDVCTLERDYLKRAHVCVKNRADCIEITRPMITCRLFPGDDGGLTGRAAQIE